MKLLDHPFIRRMSLRHKLVAIALAASGCALAVALFIFVSLDLPLFRAGMMERLSTGAHAVAEPLAAPLAFRDEDAARDVLQILAARTDVRLGCVYDDEGRLFAEFHSSAPGCPPAPPRGTGEPTFGADALSLVQPVRQGPRALGSLYVEAALDDFRARVTWHLGIAGLVLFLCALTVPLAARPLQALVDAPILRLTRAMREVTRDKRFDIRVPRTSDDEIGELVDGFNHMLAQIQARDSMLEQHRDHLESEVVARTAELRCANEALLEAKNRAEDASRAKGEFLANMSHEIRTPMNAVLAVTELLLDTELTPAQRDYLEIADGSGRALLGIINDILDFSKIEAGQMQLDPVPFLVRDLVADVVRPLAFQAEQKGLQVMTHVTPDVPHAVVGDPGRLRQVIANLLGNAVKFTNQGRILLSAGVERAEPGALTLHFRVNDTGIGVPPDKQAQIFEAFRQADGSTTRRFGGTGLGLTISQRIVELMSGRLWLESIEGQGSTFHFTVQVGHAAGDLDVTPSRRDRRTPAGRSPCEALTVLLAEDNPTNRQLAAAILKNRGHRVLAARTGAEAVALWEERREGIDAVLMDLQMPEVSGLEATARIRARESEIGGHTRIIAMTAHALNGDRERCLAAGMDAYISKPIDRQALLAILEDGSAALPPGRPAAAPACSLEAFFQRVGGDGQIAREMIAVFLADLDRMVGDIRRAADDRNASALRAAAHALKGAASNFDAAAVVAATVALESRGSRNDFESVDEAVSRLDHAVHGLVEALRPPQGRDICAS